MLQLSSQTLAETSPIVRMADHGSPSVSVCLPTYNDAAYISRCLESLLQQGYQNFEILIGDDCSDDHTAQVVAAHPDPRIRYIRNERNLGQFENVNSLIQQATGELIAIYHSDDAYDPHIVEKEAAFLQANPGVAAVFAMDYRIDAQDNISGKMRLLPEIRPRAPLTLQDLLPILLRNRNRVFRAPTFMGRASIFREVGLFSSNYAIVGDFEMWLRIADRYPVAILDEPLMYYRRGETQVSSGYERLRTQEDPFFVIMDRYLTRPGCLESMDAQVLTEYRYHRCADETFRAENWLILGQPDKALQLLSGLFPYRSLMIYTPDLTWRKLRLLVLRLLMRLGLALGAVEFLGRLLSWTEYGGRDR